MTINIPLNIPYIFVSLRYFNAINPKTKQKVKHTEFPSLFS